METKTGTGIRLTLAVLQRLTLMFVFLFLSWFSFTFTFSFPSVYAQRQMKVYIKGGLVDKVQMDGNVSIKHSRVDLNGMAHDDFVVMSITDAEGRNRQYLISQLDSLVLPNGRRVVFHGFINVNENQNENQNENLLPPYRGGLGRGFKRTSFGGTFPGGSGVTYYWTENDHIRLDVGYESRAKSLSNNNTEASFVFEDADLDATGYTVYYPDKEVTILSHQTQTGANNTDHIGPSGDCGVATATHSGAGSYRFALQHKAAYLCFLPHIDHLPSAKVTRIELYCVNPIAGCYQLAQNGLYSASNTSNTIVLDLVPQRESDFFIGHDKIVEQDSVAAYMVIAPQDASRSFTATYYVTDTLSRISKVYRQSFSFKPEANTVYPITFNISDADFHAIDLGLSCNWSNVNAGADDPSKTGPRYASETEANTALLEQTVVTEWLMPDEDQKEEVLEKCEWTRGIYNGATGYFVEGASVSKEYGQKMRIFIPCGEDRTEEQCLEDNCRPVEALMIDLGLSSGTKWAARNIGANSVEDYGSYFAWGEVEPKISYISDTYKWGTQNLGNNLDISGTQDDAAVVNWGGLWRIPNYIEMDELINHCEWYWNTINGVNGYIVEGSNGNRIFLPAGGVMVGNSLDAVNSRGGYFTSVEGDFNSSHAYSLYFNSSATHIYSGDVRYPFGYYENDVKLSAVRYYGRNIRAVAAPNAVSPDGMMLNIVTDSAAWHLGDIEAVLYGTLSSSTPIKGEVAVGFVVGDSANIRKDLCRFLYEQTTSVAGSFSQILPVYDNIGYWYRAYVETADTIFYGAARHYGYEMVDLGLSVKWASMNIGASAPEDYGYYYAWGETKTKDGYNSSTYLYGTRNLGNGTNHDIAGTENDAAHVNMGNAWRMPTKDEMEELMNSDNCRWQWTSQNNVNGYKVTSLKEGYTDKSIFLPAAGVMAGETHDAENSRGGYLTSVQGDDNSWYAYSLYFNSGETHLYNTDVRYPFGYYENDVNLSAVRYYGRTIRAVAAPNSVTSDGLVLDIRTDSATWKWNDAQTLLYGTLSSTTPLPYSVKVGFVIGDNDSIVKTNARFVKEHEVDVAGSFNEPLAVHDNIGYWYRAYVELPDTTFYGKACHYGLEMVDLGLPSKTLWANMNVGASSPEEYGCYYAWGETSIKENYSTNYVFGNTNLGNGSKQDIQGTEHDAAHVNMGNVWYMPTKEDMEELMDNDNCSWVYVSQNNVNGYKVTSMRNRNSIFLPAAGVMAGTNLDAANSRGSYLTSAQGGDNSWYAYSLYFNSGAKYLYHTDVRYPFGYYENDVNLSAVRYYGRTIRAVAKPNAFNADSTLVMNILTDSAVWKLNDTSATIYGMISSTTPLPEGTQVGFIVGNSSAVVKGEGTKYPQGSAKYGIFSQELTGLRDNIGRWYCAYIETSDSVYYGKARHFGWEMVDLGLPSRTLWCNMNVGSNWPEEYGNYYAWGETSAKGSYGSSTYPLGTSIIGNDGDIAGTLHDAAWVRMNSDEKSDWCMPTDVQMTELMNESYCKWQWVTQNDVNGYLITSKTNDNYIFLPAAGVMVGGSPDAISSRGSYLTSKQGGDNSWYAYSLYFNPSAWYLYHTDVRYPFGYYENDVNLSAVRYYGRSIRAVAAKE